MRREEQEASGRLSSQHRSQNWSFGKPDELQRAEERSCSGPLSRKGLCSKAGFQPVEATAKSPEPDQSILEMCCRPWLHHRTKILNASAAQASPDFVSSSDLQVCFFLRFSLTTPLDGVSNTSSQHVCMTVSTRSLHPRGFWFGLCSAFLLIICVHVNLADTHNQSNEALQGLVQARFCVLPGSKHFHQGRWDSSLKQVATLCYPSVDLLQF